MYGMYAMHACKHVWRVLMQLATYQVNICIFCYVPHSVLHFRLQQAFNGVTVVTKCIEMTAFDL